MRQVPEWVGRTDDAAIPDRVKLRIFNRYNGRCYLTGRKLMAGEYDFDHIVSLANGGRHCESNLAPVYRPAHRLKTKADRAEQAKVARTRKKHIGIRPAPKMRGRNTFKAWEPNIKFINEKDYDT